MSMLYSRSTAISIFLACALSAGNLRAFVARSDGADQDTTSIRFCSEVNESTVTATIAELQSFGTRYWADSNRERVFSMVAEHFAGEGIADLEVDSFQFGGTWQKNIVATLPGGLHPEAEIVLGAHLDSYSSDLSRAPGADDNASGLAAVLEIARVLAKLHYQPSVTIRFIGFAAEEAGLKGSSDYASKANQRGQNIKVMMNYDMIGYRDSSSGNSDFNIIWYPGSEAFSDLFARHAVLYTHLAPVLTTQHQSSSDSWSFFQRGYFTLFVMEHDFSPYYHQPADSLSKLDISYVCDIVRSGLASLLTLDEIPAIPLGLTAQGGLNEVVLRWNRSTSLDLIGYYVYRRSNESLPFLRISSLTAADTLWCDTLYSADNYEYCVTAVDLVGLESGMSDTARATPLVTVQTPSQWPVAFRLEQNYPNPFNPSTTIKYLVSERSYVTLKIYSLVGEAVTVLAEGLHAPGTYEVRWDAVQYASGVYFYRLVANGFQETKALLITK